jgi:hypothetical protein
MASRPLTIPTIAADVLAKKPHMRLGDPEMKPTMDALRQRIKDDPAFGRQLLRQAGIVDAKGKLAKSFGG